MENCEGVQTPTLHFSLTRVFTKMPHSTGKASGTRRAHSVPVGRPVVRRQGVASISVPLRGNLVSAGLSRRRPGWLWQTTRHGFPRLRRPGRLHPG